MILVQRVYLAPYGVGLGHASRLILLAESLNRLSIRFHFSSFGEASHYIKGQGFECNLVPPVEFHWGKDGEFSVKNNINKIPQWLVNLPWQINKEIKYLKKFNPQVVVSDSRLSPLIASNILQIPRILVINQIKLLLTPRLREFKAAKIFETCNAELMGGLWNIADRILVPDLPPPYTISEENINSVKSVRKKIEYIGFTTPRVELSQTHINKVRRDLKLDSTKPVIFVHISGPQDTRLPIINALIRILKNQRVFQIIISEGKANGSVQPRKISENIWYYEWCPCRDEIFLISDILIIRGGHTAISQAIQFGKPFISLPIESHGEQLSNAEKIVKLGIGCKIDAKSINDEVLFNTLTELFSNLKYKEEIDKLAEISTKLNGIENIKNIILSYS
ncbi:UDP-N-acetylglucosamine--N-acetylmuramyl-(Pentapeptide) pyrophosphoryl-undecaprenol N-acetylglucosamine transferase [Candidatus Nitrosocosmicus franklandus]|uniref:UDP-N-acetylglucosamine--N-acetylmuramyl-(Pentapeptide) pyrophosphoryl-undecaprenol N-acetylglucosamine transferase n=1 Tax=Candidatus Nitrosocosmicus franklandianus TaxID=1798806 RepID=A0A484IDK6_9ARCH|nr:UDP-N-acetylglucosamine--N-acetylmuramyl-(Pentapeptide) pyrophosphoryl-undecaprenol N-acetylglucosamine transferase [Candidatus Nitrosocosmicus franklandus]